MELRQLRSFVRVVELNSMGRAAVELGLATSTLSQQISMLESELCTRLLQRRPTGVYPTDAGLDFWHQAQVILKQVDIAASVAQKGRLSGQVTVGMTGSTATMLALPFVQAMRESYPTVNVRLIEGLTSNLQVMLNSRQLDLAVVFGGIEAKRWSVIPLAEERLFIIGRPNLAGWPACSNADGIRLSAIERLPLILPGPGHALRSLVDEGFRTDGATPNVILEIDGAHTLMRAVRAGVGASVQPGSLLSSQAGFPSFGYGKDDDLSVIPVAGSRMARKCFLVSLSDDELSPAGLAARVMLTRMARTFAEQGIWLGATTSICSP
ncbi:LysR family transcriptional regulator [Bordetella tumbae]|uniref:LysR substrate-binding domain-containing protein n=1 Tax=Bordetella tumbae TaxID=1649139 RepID=UPI0039EEA2CF